MTRYYFPTLSKEEAPCCVAQRDDVGRLPVGFCGPDCQRRPIPVDHRGRPTREPPTPLPPQGWIPPAPEPPEPQERPQAPPRPAPQPVAEEPDDGLLPCTDSACRERFADLGRLTDHMRLWHRTPRPARKHA